MSDTVVHEVSDRVRQMVYGAMAPLVPDDFAARVAALTSEEWQSVLHLVRQHRVGPMLHYGLKQAGLLELVPEEVGTALKQQQKRWGIRNLRTHAELVRVCGLLKEEGIDFIALKGAYLATYAYPSLGLRPLRDIDLLVHPEDGMKAFELLQAHGYASEEHGDTEAFIAQIKHFPPMTHPNGAHVELHLRLTSPRNALEERPWIVADEATLWGQTMFRTVGGSEIRFMDPIDLLLHLAQHGMIDHRLNIGPLGVADFAWLLATHKFDWPQVVERAQSCGLERHLLSFLMLASTRMEATVPDAVLIRLGRQSDWLEVADHLIFCDPGHSFVMNRAIRKMFFVGSVGARLARVVQELFPVRERVASICGDLPREGWTFLKYPLYWRRRIEWIFSRTGWSVLRQRRALKLLAQRQTLFDDWLNGR